jgi:hypothetical protein
MASHSTNSMAAGKSAVSIFKNTLPWIAYEWTSSRATLTAPSSSQRRGVTARDQDRRYAAREQTRHTHQPKPAASVLADHEHRGGEGVLVERRAPRTDERRSLPAQRPGLAA